MSVPFLVTPAQMRRIRLHFPFSHGIPRVDDRRVLSGIIFVIQGCLRRRDAPPGADPGQMRATSAVKRLDLPTGLMADAKVELETRILHFSELFLSYCSKVG